MKLMLVLLFVLVIVPVIIFLLFGVLAGAALHLMGRWLGGTANKKKGE